MFQYQHESRRPPENGGIVEVEWGIRGGDRKEGLEINVRDLNQGGRGESLLPHVVVPRATSHRILPFFHHMQYNLVITSQYSHLLTKQRLANAIVTILDCVDLLPSLSLLVELK